MRRFPESLFILTILTIRGHRYRKVRFYREQSAAWFVASSNEIPLSYATGRKIQEKQPCLRVYGRHSWSQMAFGEALQVLISSFPVWLKNKLSVKYP